MSKYSFLNDYGEGAHPNILAALEQSNLEQEKGYGEDRHCSQAATMIKAAAGRPDADVHFLSGGTQANLTALAAFLRPYESAIAVPSAHIHVHEAGAIEATGHKIHAVTGVNGKVTPQEVEEVAAEHNDEHMVVPRLVFTSQSTELGTVYSRAEFAALAETCRRLGLYLYVDGARLGQALACGKCDLTLEALSSLADAYYIGGTKNGALIGEAMVICNSALKLNFRHHLKQRGALLSKGRLLGIQFQELFRDDLYLQLAAHANRQAQKLATGIRELGYPFLIDSPTNQIFPILPLAVIDAMMQNYLFYTWSRMDGERSAVRLVTSWATPDWAVEGFLSDLARAS